MAFDTNVPPGQLQFDQILQAEIQAINQRRRFLGRKELITPFLWSEITGRLYENSDEVYLTDGGHIENLGV